MWLPLALSTPTVSCKLANSCETDSQGVCLSSLATHELSEVPQLPVVTQGKCDLTHHALLVRRNLSSCLRMHPILNGGLTNCGFQVLCPNVTLNSSVHDKN